MVRLIEQPSAWGELSQATPGRLIRQAAFLNRAAQPHENLMVIHEFETATGGRFTKTIFTAWKGL